MGAGGCGKTRLALKSAAESVERFADGVWWVELAALEDGELVAGAVMPAIGLRERAGQAPVDVLLEHLRGAARAAGARQLRAPAGGVRGPGRRLLRACPGLVVMATSREVLGVSGELPAFERVRRR